MKKKVLAVVLSIIGLLLLTGVALAQVVDTSGALYRASLSIQNTATSLGNFIIPFKFSGQSLVDQNFIKPSGLNSVIVGTDGSIVPSMPPSQRLNLGFCKQYIASSTTTTDYTTECTNSTVGDIPFFTSSAAEHDAFYFGLQQPGSIILLNIQTAADWDGQISWEYWNGDAGIWDFLPDLEDTSNGFSSTGLSTVSFTLPTNWGEASFDGDVAYWIRARLVNNPTTLIAPQGSQIWWESGLWWTFVPNIEQNEQISYALYLGGTDMQEYHHIFVGEGGITTPDDASIELGDDFAMRIIGWVDTSSGSNKDLINKSGAIRLYVSSSETLTLAINGSDVLTINNVPTGHHVIEIVSDTATLSLTVHGVGTVNTSAISVTDNGSDWLWAINNSMTYIQEIRIFFPEGTSFITGGEFLTGVFSGSASSNTGAGIYMDVRPQKRSCTMSGLNASGIRSISSDGTNLYIANRTDGVVYSIDINTCAATSLFSFSQPRQVAFDGANFWVIQDTSNNLYKVDNTGAILNTYNIGTALYGVAFGPDENGVDHVWTASLNGAIRKIDPSTGAVVSSFTIFDDGVSGSSPSSNTTRGSNLAYFDGHLYYYTSVNYINSGGVKRDRVKIWKVKPTSGEIVWTFNPSYRSNAASSTFIGVLNESNIILSFLNSNTLAFYDGTGVLTGPALRFGMTNNNDVPGWSVNTQHSGSASGFEPVPESGLFSAKIRKEGTVGSCPCGGWWQQQLPAAEGQVWSASAMYRISAQSGQFCCQPSYTRVTSIIFRQGNNTLQTFTSSTGGMQASENWFIQANNNRTAPPGTDNVIIRFEFTGGTVGWTATMLLDSAMACQCAAAPTFPNAANLLSNPGFENWYRTSGSWVSPTITFPGITNVSSSTIQWQETVFPGSSYEVQISDDNQATWTPVSNGDPFALPGSDISSTNFNVRILFTSDGSSTPVISGLQLSVLDDSGTTLLYNLQELPGLVLIDESGTGNDGIMTFPLVYPDTITSSQGALRTTGVRESQRDQQLSPDVGAEVDPGIWTGGFIGDDIPLHALWVALSSLTGGDIPPIMYWIVFSTFVTLTAGVLTFMFTQSVPWSAAVVGMFLLGFVNFGGGLLPMWVFFFSGVMLMAASVYSKIKAM